MIPLDVVQWMLVYAAQCPTHLALVLLQASRRATEYGSPEYWLLDRMVLREARWNDGNPIGPRLENEMFLSSI